LDFSLSVRFSQPGEYQLSLYTIIGGYDSVNVTVYAATTAPPTVTLTAPATNSVFSQDAVIPVSAAATPSGGTITNVEFFAFSTYGATLIGRKTNAPYSINWLPAVPGDYTLRARAFDDGGRVGISMPVPIHVLTNGNHSPRANYDYPIVLANSVNNILYNLLDNDTDEDSDGLVITEIIPPEKAQIVAGGKAVSYTPPPGIQGYPADGFSYRISDGKGGTALGGVYVYVFASEVPEVRIVAPVGAHQTYVTNGGAVTPITAQIANTDFITKVEFFRNGVKLGTVTNGTSGNFTLNWIATRENCTCGIRAEATDSFGQVNTSDPIFIDVTPPAGVTNPSALIESAVSALATNGVVDTNALGGGVEMTIREGLFDLYGRAFQAQGSNVVWRLGIYSTDGTLLRELTPVPINGDGYNTNAVGSASVSNELASCDLTTLENGVYDFKLTVTSAYITTNQMVRFRLESNLKIGQFGFSQQDLVIPVAGIPLTVVRTYNSLNLRRGDFGYGWTYSLNDVDVVLDEERQETEGWSLGNEEDPAEFFSQRIGGGRNVTLTLPDGQRTTFAFYFDGPHTCVSGAPSPYCWFGRWQAAPGVRTWGLEAQGNNTLNTLLASWGTGQPYWEAGGDSRLPMDAFDFRGFVLTNLDGTKYFLDREDGGEYSVLTQEGSNYVVQAWGKPRLSRIEQRTGDKIYIQSDQVYHTNPTNGVTRRIIFQRNEAGLITGISDPLGLDGSGQPSGPLAVKYEYDSQDNLIRVLRLVDRNTSTYTTNTYHYDNPAFPHYITGIINGNGVPVARNNYDDSGRLVSVQDADGNFTQFIHNTTNRLEVKIDRLGRTNTLAYDTRGNVTAATNALGGVTLMAYDDLNNKTNAVAFLNGQPYATNHFGYDADGLLLSATDALGHSNSVTYNAYGQVTTSTDARGNSGTNVYDSSGNLIAAADPFGNTASNFFSNGQLVGFRDAGGTRTTNYFDSIGNLSASATLSASGAILSTNSFEYDANGNRTNSTVWRRVNGSWTGATATYIFDAQNRVVQTIEPDGGTNTVVYSATGQSLSTTDKLGRTTTYQYDYQDRLVLTTYPDLTTETSAFDAMGNRTNSVDRAGRTTSFIYDALNRLTRMIYPDNTSTRTIYDDLGRIRFAVDARGTTNAFGYDPADRSVAVTNGWGTSIAITNLYGFDANGNEIYLTNTLGRVTTNVFDALNRRVQVLYPDGTKTSVAFDIAGRRVAETNQDNIVTLFGYDGSRLISVTNAFGKAEQMVTRFEFDEAGNFLRQIDALNRTNTFAYDSFGRRIAHWMPDTNLVERFSYNLAGNLIYYTNFNGVVVTNQYDVMNRLTNRASINGYQVSFAYSPTDERTNMTDVSGTTSYSYDNRDRLQLKTVAWNGGPTISLNYRFDASGNLTNLWSSMSGGVTNVYQFDLLDRLTNVLANGSVAAAYGFDAVGNLQSVRYGNGVTNQFQYDVLNRLTNAAWKLNASTLGNFSYQLGLAGNRTNLSETVNGTSRTYAWAFDSLYRLKQETLGGGTSGTLSYSFDPVGNRTNRTVTGGLSLTNQSFTFNTNDWLTSDGYDNNGNTTNSSGTSYQFDALNHLTNMNNGAVLITYNGDGARVKKTVGSTTTYYLVDDQNPSGYAQVLEEWTASGGTTNLSRVYNYGLQLISERQPSLSTNYFVFDGRGSTRVLADNGGNVVNAFAFDAYGNLIASNAAPQTLYLYCGQQWDPDLGQYYNRARYYQPGTGRFWTMDPYEGESEDPKSLHRYTYCSNDPVNFWDPSGLARYEYDSQGLHVHDKDAAGKLTYMVNVDDNGRATLSAKPGHEREFNAERARKHFGEVVNNPKEFKKIRDVVKDAHDRFSDKEGIARTGRNLRRARLAFRSLAIVAWGLALDPHNADAVQRLKTGMDKIDRDVRNHTTPSDSDIDDVMIAIKDIYGFEPAALWYWNRLLELQESVDSDSGKDSVSNPGKDIGSEIKIHRTGGVEQINTFGF
jgi:RHS repeat-associated protein